MKRGIILLLLIPFILILILFLVRALTDKQLDDISPEIPCEKNLLEKSDILYIIPKFKNKSIAENTEWCSEILAKNKQLALHGVYHTYEEFKEDRNEAYLKEGIDAFETCFHTSPKRFKSPQLVTSKNNKRLIIKKMKIDSYSNQLFHKVYHCNDTGKFHNSFIDYF